MTVGGRYTVPLADVEHIDASELFAISGTQRAVVHAGRPRIAMVALAFAIGYFGLMVRSVGLTIFDHRPVSTKSQNVKAAVPQRARLTDRNGRLLASSIETYSAYIKRVHVRDGAALAIRLATIKGLPSEKILQARLEGSKGRARLGRRLTPTARDAIFSMGLAGVEFIPEQTRYYPYGSFAAHFLGWLNADGKAIEGAERAFEHQLLDKNTRAFRLSLDVRVQFALEDEIHIAMSEFHPKSALGIVTNIKTGEVLALAAQPLFNPNWPGRSSREERRNRAATDLYELGSVFKPITLAMAFDQGLVAPDDLLDVVSPLIVNGKKINDMHPSRRKMSVRNILIESSNKGAAMIALKVGRQMQQHYLGKFGLLEPARIELAESANYYRTPGPWRDVTTATIGYGHGIMVTPFAFVQAMGALANNGRLVPLTLRAREKNSKPEGTSVISPQAARSVIEIMREVVRTGTGRRADVKGYDVVGKTGSAEKLDEKTGRYVKDRNISSFVAIFPVDDPQYLVFILLDEPKGDKRTSGWETAGWNAAPVAGRVISRIGPVLLPRAQRPDLRASIAEQGQ